MSSWPRALSIDQFLDALRRLPEYAGDGGKDESSTPRVEDVLLAETWDTHDSARNVLVFPDGARNPRADVLAAAQGGLLTDSSLRARVSVILGPGATPRGIAEQVRPIFVAAATAAQPPPTVDELAEGILVYSQFYIPVPNMTNYADGLRIPLPIEIDQVNGDWIVNSDSVRLWAGRFPAGAQPLLDRRPARLDQPDPDALPGEVQAFLQAHATVLERGVHLQARILTNPFREIFFFFESMRQLGADAFEVALALFDQSVNHQMQLLGTLTAGNAILRRLVAALARRPGRLTAQQNASLARATNMLQSALVAGGALVARRELPETPQQLADQPGGLGPWQHVQPTDPPGGRHRMVLGRDVLAGDIAAFPPAAPTHRGPAYGGRISPTTFIATNGNVLNPTADAALAARLRIVQAIAVNEGFLDAVRMRDAGILSVGMQQWSAHADLELPALLGHYKQMAPNEFMLFFGIYDLEVRPNGQDGHGNPQFMLQRVRPDGTRVDLVTPGSRRDFFGGVTAGGVTTFDTVWAARSREPAIASLRFRAAEVLEATARLDRVAREVGSITVGGVPVPLTTLITSQLGVALILDTHINQPAHVRADLQAAANAAGAQPTADALDHAITQQYAAIRHTQNTPARNANINAQGLDPHHGSFAGWVAPPPAGFAEWLSGPEARAPDPPPPAWPTSTEVAREEGPASEDEPACKESWLAFLGTFPADVRDALSKRGPDSAVVVAIHQGIRDLEKLTRLSFDAKWGGERGYCPVARSDTHYRNLKELERRLVKNYLARPLPPLGQHGGVLCQRVERRLEAAKPDDPAVDITGRYEYRESDAADPRWTITKYTFNVNQAGRHIEGHMTTVLRPRDRVQDRPDARFHGDLQADGSFVVYGLERPDQLWGYLTHERRGQDTHVYWQLMASDRNEPAEPRVRLHRISDSPTLMEWAFSDQAFPKWGPLHLHEQYPLTQAQIKHLVRSLADDKIAPLLQTYFAKPADDRVVERDALIDAAKPLHRHIEKVFNHTYFGIHLFDMDLARYYATTLLSHNKWTFKGITRSQLDWIQIMLDVTSGYGFALPNVTNYLGLKSTVGPGQEPVDPTTKPNTYKVSYSLRGFLVYYRGTITVEKTSGMTWKETFKITLKGFQVKPGFSISEEGEAETYHDWTERDIPGSVELVTGKLGGRIPGLKATAGAWFMHIFGSHYLPYMDVLGAEVKAKISLDKKFKMDLVNLGGLWGEIYEKTLPDKDYSKFAPVTDYVAAYKLQDDVHFCLGSALLTERARQALRIVCANELAAFREPESTLRIVGHADRVDTDERNYELSEMRARNTLSALRDVLGDSFNIPDDTAHITLEWKGEEEAAKAQPGGQKPDPRFRRVDVFLNTRLIISLKGG